MSLLFVPVTGAANPPLAAYVGLTRCLDSSKFTAAVPTNGRAVSVSPDGSKIAYACTSSPYLVVYDAASFSPITISGGNPAGTGICCKFSPDGAYLAVGHDTAPFLTIYETTGWTKVTGLSANPSGAVNAIAFTPDGSKLFVACQSSPGFYGYNTSDWTQMSDTPSLGGNGTGCAVHPDGTKVAITGTAALPYVWVYNIADWTAVASTPGGGPVAAAQCCAYSPDGNRFYVGSSGSQAIYAYDLVGATRTLLIAGGTGLVYSIVPSADGTKVWACNQGGYLNEYQVGSWTRTWVQPVTVALYIMDEAPASLSEKYIGTTAADPVTDQNNNPIVTDVRAYLRRTGELLGATTTAADGSFSLGPFASQQEMQVTYLYPSGSPLRNDLIHRVIPA